MEWLRTTIPNFRWKNKNGVTHSIIRSNVYWTNVSVCVCVCNNKDQLIAGAFVDYEEEHNNVKLKFNNMPRFIDFIPYWERYRTILSDHWLQMLYLAHSTSAELSYNQTTAGITILIARSRSGTRGWFKKWKTFLFTLHPMM